MSVTHWERYYRSGGLATCPTAADGSYDREVREAWESFFAALPEGAAILDVGTGNGAIVLIARELGRGLRIHGSDLARIDPARHVPNGRDRFAGIEFHAGVATEAMPFPDAHFDAVTGQYALEYMNAAAALGEIRRVLRSGGVAQFILHHHDSVLVDNARESLGQARLVREETAVHARLRRLIAAERASPAAASEAADAMNAALRILQDAAERARSPLILEVTLDAVKQIWDARTTGLRGRVEQEIDQVEGDLAAAVERLEDLVGHALSEEDLAALLEQARAAGFEVAAPELQYHAGHNLVGWRVTLAVPE